MITPSANKMVFRIFVLLFLSFPFAIRGYAATFVPASYTTMTGAGTYCQNVTANQMSFIYSTCSSGGGAPVGISCTVKWYYNTTNSTTVGTATLVSSTTQNSGVAGPGNSFTYVPSTAVQGTYYYFVVVTWTGAGTCNNSGTLTTGTATTLVTVNDAPAVIAGNAQMCAGSTAITLSNSSTGGTWSGGTPGIATVGLNTGLVTPGATQGTATITYKNACGSASITATVNATPVPITGNVQMCASSTAITLSNSSTNGTWSGGTAGIATVDMSTGIVTPGATQGTTTITYSNGCGGSGASITATVNATPAAITGNVQMCASGSTSTLSETSANGTWSGGTAGIATVGANTGVVTPGATQGTTNISYTNGCGTASVTCSVNATPVPIGGNISLCIGGPTSQLSDNGSPNGTWSGGTPGIATIDATGVVTPGATQGTTNISYTNGCGTATATVTVGAPNAGSLSGPAGVCISSAITLSDAVTGGVWSSNNAGVATVDASGDVTGVSSGSAVISYTVTNGCGPATATYTVTATTAANAGTIVGPTSMCAGSFVILTDAAAGGTWNAGNGDATVNSNGLLTAVTPGIDVISYTVSNACGPTVATLTVNIGPYLDAGSISGLTSVCAGSNIVLSDNIPGGVWSSTNSTVATISGVGVVSGVTAGTTTISYLMISGCGSLATTYTVTVNPLPVPGTITGGPSAICTGAFAMLTDASPGGVWSSTNSAVATVTNAGVVSATTIGSAIISYSVTNVCGTLAATFPVTASVPPNPGSISGLSSVCVGSNIALTDPIAGGGVWSSANTNASVSIAGIVTGVAGGAATISFTSTTGCGSLSISVPVTVNPQPDAGNISGPSSVCIGSSVALTDAASGGVWSSNTTSVATVDASGLVTSVGTGATTISYTVANVCNTAVTTQLVTVNALPVVAPITGSANVCLGSSITLSDATSGGLWSSSNTNCTIVSGASGLVVSGVTAGTAVISYALTNLAGCTVTATATENINALPVVAVISGTGIGCVGVATTLSDATSGGVWSSSNTSIATIDPASGSQTGVANGAVTVSYTVTNIAGCSITVIIAETILAAPAASATSGSTTICDGAVTTLSNPVSGGVWSSANSVATVDATGDVTGLAAGTDYIIYAVTNVCGTVFDSALITVNSLPVVDPISAAGTAICIGTTTTLSESATGGAWSSANPAIATVSSAGVVTGAAAGIVAISYSATSGSCTSESILLISVAAALPVASVTPAGSATLCHGNPVALTAAASGSAGTFTYQWSVGSTPIPGATASVYTADIAGTYSVIISNGTCSETIAGTVVVSALDPVIGFTAPNVLFTGSFTTYQWFLNGIAIAGETSSILNETGGGAYTVVVTDGNGCSDTSAVYTIATTGINSVSTTQDIKIYPNPAAAVLHIDAPAQVNVSILSVDGKVVITQKNAANIDVSGLANGMYIIMIYDENNNFIKSAKFAKAE